MNWSSLESLLWVDTSKAMLWELQLTAEIYYHTQGIIEQMEVVTITRDIAICKRHVIGKG